MAVQRRGQNHAGHAASAFFADGMIITFDKPFDTLARGDTLSIRKPHGGTLEMIPAGLRPNGAVSVWYAPHPLLRHWLGWMEQIDAVRWRFHMEPYHIDILRGIPALCEDITQVQPPSS
jgi:hypothetical protein